MIATEMPINALLAFWFYTVLVGVFILLALDRVADKVLAYRVGGFYWVDVYKCVRCGDGIDARPSDDDHCQNCRGGPFCWQCMNNHRLECEAPEDGRHN